jgi:osmotically-inducible protein OsmY
MTVSKVFVLAAAVATVGLSGCAPILIGGAAVTSATVITDRRTTGSIVDDEVLEKRVRYEIGEVIGHEKHHVVVTSYEGKVLLTGEVLTAADRQKVQDTAVKSVGVHSVINELAVMTPATVGAVLSDSMLATKVRSSIIGTKKISLNQMKVDVQRGIVYLMGIVTIDEARTATKVAAGVSGVQQVVTCFTIESEAAIKERLKNLESNNSSKSAEP